MRGLDTAGALSGDASAGTVLVSVCSVVLGAGVGSRDESVEEASQVRSPRSLMVSFTGLGGSGGGVCRVDCCEATNPCDSSDELSVPSGVESESNRGKGERRFLERWRWSSSSPSTLGLGRFLDMAFGTTLTFGMPVWGPAILRTEE